MLEGGAAKRTIRSRLMTWGTRRKAGGARLIEGRPFQPGAAPLGIRGSPTTHSGTNPASFRRPPFSWRISRGCSREIGSIAPHTHFSSPFSSPALNTRMTRRRREGEKLICLAALCQVDWNRLLLIWTTPLSQPFLIQSRLTNQMQGAGCWVLSRLGRWNRAGSGECEWDERLRVA